MKTISLPQPEATLVMLGAKRFHICDLPTDYRGPVAICAVPDPHGEQRAQQPPARDVLTGQGLSYTDLPVHAILGTVELVDIQPSREHVHTVDRTQRKYNVPWWMAEWMWVLGPAQPYPAPVAVEPQGGIWEWEPAPAPEPEAAPRRKRDAHAE